MKLTDVAKRAGVSPTTVSRVINNYGSLSQKTIDKVHAAMKELNYQPNAAARSLQGKNTQLIGLLFPSVAHPFLVSWSIYWRRNYLRAATKRFYVTVLVIVKKNEAISKCSPQIRSMALSLVLII